jgi:Domain of unknown function (DUF6457)
VDEWLRQARDKLAAATGEDPSAYELSQEETDDLLDLARVAARDSGERINAPLLCYLVGVAHGRHGGDLSALVDAAVGSA